MVTLRSQVSGGARLRNGIRSKLQQSRDHVASRISKKWLSPGNTRPLGSRGLQLLHGWCFINSVIQALMHQPQLLNWVQSHRHTTHGNSTDLNPACTACVLRDLARVYWANTPVSRLVPNPGPDMTRIAQILVHGEAAVRDGNGMHQDDPLRVFEVFHTGLQQSSRNANWGKAFNALFLLDTQSYLQCQRCDHRRPSANQSTRTMELYVRPTFANALTDFFSDTMDAQCPECGPAQGSTRQTQDIRILAGPQILTIMIKMFNQVVSVDKFGTYSVTNTRTANRMQLPKVLDLSQYQQDDGLPLRYNISSIIGQSGTIQTGHFVATVKGPGDKVTMVDDDVTEKFTEARMLATPQVLSMGNPKDAYIVTYLRDDGELTKEQKALKKLM
ncbi:ubiquitin carboxyl-terminal hydrolase 22 27 51 [Pyrenophora seminiperda CCB06]|uniref:Ubiquitin carboxyl-terminal hydrolase 22 27 51 n=1 Tax=Pyrenophora seminiperda CCB06 TaxID=1302712 RepID=A0A3M7LY69_9PLEO|nr:ubiquitin carboxyl-terminal hydrolase 22 27 51 [Pyrenophora seminiperda CCB06]